MRQFGPPDRHPGHLLQPRLMGHYMQLAVRRRFVLRSVCVQDAPRSNTANASFRTAGGHQQRCPSGAMEQSSERYVGEV